MAAQHSLVRRIGVCLYALARTRPMQRIIREVFAHMSFAIPVKRLRETDTLVAFHHPSPSYPVHILLVPKRAYPSFLAVTLDDQDFQRDLFAAVQSLVQEFDLESKGYRFLVNGGAYQDVPILHFHLVSNHE